MSGNPRMISSLIHFISDKKSHAWLTDHSLSIKLYSAAQIKCQDLDFKDKLIEWELPQQEPALLLVHIQIQRFHLRSQEQVPGRCLDNPFILVAKVMDPQGERKDYSVVDSMHQLMEELAPLVLRVCLALISELKMEFLQLQVPFQGLVMRPMSQEDKKESSMARQLKQLVVTHKQTQNKVIVMKAMIPQQIPSMLLKVSSNQNRGLRELLSSSIQS